MDAILRFLLWHCCFLRTEPVCSVERAFHDKFLWFHGLFPPPVTCLLTRKCLKWLLAPIRPISSLCSESAFQTRKAYATHRWPLTSKSLTFLHCRALSFACANIQTASAHKAVMDLPGFCPAPSRLPPTLHSQHTWEKAIEKMRDHLNLNQIIDFHTSMTWPSILLFLCKQIGVLSFVTVFCINTSCSTVIRQRDFRCRYHVAIYLIEILPCSFFHLSRISLAFHSG